MPTIRTHNVDDIIRDDLFDGDRDLSDAYNALDAYLSGNTQGSYSAFISVANNLGDIITQALRTGNAEALRFASETTRELANNQILQSRDVDNIIAADVNNNDGDLNTAYEALFALTTGRTQDSSFNNVIGAANNIGGSIVKALQLGDFENIRFASEAVRELATTELLQSRDVDNIVWNDVNNNDGDLNAAYEALFALTNGQTQDSSFDWVIDSANRIGGSIVKALQLGDFENIRFASEAVRELATTELLQSRDVDNIIAADVNNNDGDLNSAYEALFALTTGRTQDSSFGDVITSANNIGSSIVKALQLGDFENIRFASEAVRELATTELLQSRDVDNIVWNDVNNNDGDLNSAYEALFALTNGQTQDSSFSEVITSANNIGGSIVKALNFGDFENIRFASEAVRELATTELLQSRDVDNIIAADVNNNDGDLYAAYEGLYALTNGQTQDSSFNEVINAADNIGSSIVRALDYGDFENVRFASEATRELGNAELINVLDIDDIIDADVTNGDGDLNSAYEALFAFAEGRTENSQTSGNDAQEVANAIVESAETAQRTMGFEGEIFANTVDMLLSGVTDTSGLV